VTVADLTIGEFLDKGKITAAASSLAASGDFVIKGRASNHACPGPPISHYTDSYNSSAGDYCSQSPDDEGDIIYSGNVDIDQGSGGSEIRGDVVAGDTVSVKGGPGGGQPFVYGWINHTNACQTTGGPPTSSCSDRITDPSADNRSIDDVRTAPPINRFLQSTVDNLENSNDNSGAPISGDRLDFSAAGPPTDVELTSGRYYLERIEFAGSGDRIEFDTSGGDIVIGVRGDVNMPNGAEMEVVGDGAVKMYVEGESSFSDGDGWTFDMEKTNVVTTPDDTAEQFRIYGQENFSFRMGNDVDNELVGIIYAPPGTSGTGEVFLDKGNIYGGVLTGTTKIKNQGSIHYDEALQGKRIISRDAKVLKITYLHVSVNRVRVD